MERTINLFQLRNQGLSALTEEQIHAICKDIILSRLRRIEVLEGQHYDSWAVQVRLKDKESLEVLAVPKKAKKEISIYKITLLFSVEEIYRSCTLERYTIKMAFERAFRPTQNIELVGRPVGFEGSKKIVFKNI